jgi:polysaccharide pyruvyl transferase WcaK-like protein
MHACIAALSQSVPAVCLAYSRKFIGVMESVGCGELVADMCSLDNDEILASIRRTFDSRVRVRDYLQKRMPEVKDGVVKLFSPERLGVSTRREDSSSGSLKDVHSDADLPAEKMA